MGDDVRSINRLKRELSWYIKAQLAKNSSGRGLFILGTGRSGTHFLTQCLISHPEFTDLMGGKENPYVFRDVVDLALNNCRDAEKIQRVLKKYKQLMKVASPKIFVDQSHPNLWLADKIAENIPGSMFVGIIRDPFSVAYSTTQHAGVSGWFDKWESFPLPNPFLGIGVADRECYVTMSIAEKSALRWISHVKRLGELKPILGDRLVIVNYEDLCNAGEDQMRRISEFLNVKNKFVMPFVTKESLYKKNKLSNEDIELMKSTIINYQNNNNIEKDMYKSVCGYLDI